MTTATVQARGPLAAHRLAPRGTLPTTTWIIAALARVSGCLLVHPYEACSEWAPFEETQEGLVCGTYKCDARHS